MKDVGSVWMPGGEWKKEGSEWYYHGSEFGAMRAVCDVVKALVVKEMIRVGRIFTLMPLWEDSRKSLQGRVFSLGTSVVRLGLSPLAQVGLLSLRVVERLGWQSACWYGTLLEEMADGDLPEVFLLHPHFRREGEDLPSIVSLFPIRPSDRRMQKEMLPPSNPDPSLLFAKGGDFRGNLSSWAEGFNREYIEERGGRTLTWSRKAAKDKAPNGLLALFASGDPRSIERANYFLLTGKELPEGMSFASAPKEGRLEPWGTSFWEHLCRLGGYDFTEMTLTTLYHKYYDKLEDETRIHLERVLLVDKGDSFTLTDPGTFGFIGFSENHLFMQESCRYLNETGENKEKLKQRILYLLKSAQLCGFYEYNSRPYVAYTVRALLNLVSFGETEVSDEARKLLDYLCFTCAVSSCDLRRYPPFRRRRDYEVEDRFDKCYLTGLMRAWALDGGYKEEMGIASSSRDHIFFALQHTYRPPGWILRIATKSKDEGESLVELGHGSLSSPEIYARYKGVLLSAGGGLPKGKIWKEEVVRPIVVFQGDDKERLEDTLHFDFNSPNQTGVCRRFACAAGCLHVPEEMRPEVEDEEWRVYRLKGVLAVAYSSSKVSLVALFPPEEDPQVLLRSVRKTNPDVTYAFQFPNGEKIEYDVQAPNGTTVIKSEGKGRDFASFPLILVDEESQTSLGVEG